MTYPAYKNPNYEKKGGWWAKFYCPYCGTRHSIHASSYVADCLRDINCWYENENGKIEWRYRCKCAKGKKTEYGRGYVVADFTLAFESPLSKLAARFGHAEKKSKHSA